MAQVYVKTRGPFLYQNHRHLNPGSIVPMDEDMAKQFVERGMGEYSEGPMREADPPSWPGGACKADGTPMPTVTNVPLTGRVIKALALAEAMDAAAAVIEDEEDHAAAVRPVERPGDLGSRLAQAEKAVARPQS